MAFYVKQDENLCCNRAQLLKMENNRENFQKRKNFFLPSGWNWITKSNEIGLLFFITAIHFSPV